MDKIQKSINQNLSTFKLNTQSQFSTINEVLQSRSQITQGKSSAANQELIQIKKNIKQLKSFMTESTRQEHEAQEIRQREQNDINAKVQSRIKQLYAKQISFEASFKDLSGKVDQLALNSAKKTQISELHFALEAQTQKIQKAEENVEELTRLLKETKVQKFKSIIQEIDQRTRNQIHDMRIKLSIKSDKSDLLKLQEMLLGMMDYSHQNILKISSNRSQTKKALIFLQKRLNSLLITLLGEDQSQRQALLTAKNFKCISCTKDLGEMQGKLQKFKPWSLFPVKQPSTKDKYSGFGAGFQSIVQTTVAKKGGQISYDQKGRMLAPFNLTSTMQGGFMKSSRSQHRLSQSKSKINISPNKNSLKYETNFMNQFGQSHGNQLQTSLISEYYTQYKGIQSVIGKIEKGKQDNKDRQLFK